MHDLEVLFILRRRSRGDLIQPLSAVPRASCIRRVEASKRGKELVMPTHTCRGNKRPHGEGIHQRVVEHLVEKA